MTALPYEALATEDPSARTMTLPPVREPVPGRESGGGDRPRPAGLLVALLLLAVAQTVVALDIDVPVVRPVIATFTMLGLPTLVLYRRSGLVVDGPLVRGLYALGASLLGLLLVSLVMNGLLPLVGLGRPLAPAVLGVTWFLVDALLLGWRRSVPLLPAVDVRDLARRAWDARLEPAQALAFAAVPLAVVGAIRLNNGASGGVALTAHLLAVAALLVLLLKNGSRGRDARVLFLLAATVLLATSLRGWGITGHDIQVESYVFGLTSDARHWSMGLFENAYTACLSVTLLPTVLTEATGVSGLVFFKVVAQLLFALVPVTVYLVSRRFVGRRLALVGVSFVVAFPTFHSDMPYLVRQEVAFLFLGLLLLAATEPGWNPWLRRGAVGFFGVGVVLSHYSTTYLLILGLLGGLLLLGVLELLHRATGRPTDREPLVLLHPATVAVLVGTALLWTGPMTHTGGHATQVAKDAVLTLLGQAEDGPGSSDVSFSLFGGTEMSERERLDRYVAETMDIRSEHPHRLALVKDPGPKHTEPELLEVDEAPLTPIGRALDGVGVDTGDVVVGARLGTAALLQVLLLSGVVWLVLGRWRALVSRDVVSTSSTTGTGPPTASREVVCVVGGVMGALGLVVLIPSLSVEYGVLRAFLQTMLFAAPVAAVGLWWLLGLARRRTTVWLVGVPVAAVVVLTSVGPALLGGGPAKLALANAGLYHDRYIVADSDVVAAERLAEAPDTSGEMPKVLTSRHQAPRVVNAGVPIGEVHDRTFPTLLNVGSYVFADARLTTTREETVFYTGDRISYRYPLGDLDRLLDLVYSAGSSRVYR